MKSYVIDLKSIFNENNGALVPLEYKNNIPFEIKRIFYIYDVPSNSVRGAHSYKETKQVLIALYGSIKIKCTYDNEEKTYILDKPHKGLYISNNIWREAYDFSEGAVLLVLSSKPYDKEDYIR